jgi:hypothetical protein
MILPRWGRVAALGLVLLLVACAAARGAGENGATPAPASPPLNLSGQRLLVLPVQQVSGLSGALEQRLDAELAFALEERRGGVTLVPPAELERALARSPGFAGDPSHLPADPLLHYGTPVAVEPLAGQLRRYAALADTRWVLLPQEVRFEPPGADEAGTLRISAVVIDARSGRVLWSGAAEAVAGPVPDAQVVAVAAAEFARRLLAAEPAGEERPEP